MGKILIIIKREYMQRVRTRGFLIGTILTPALLLAFSLLPVLLASRESGPRKIAVLDQTGDSGLFSSIRDKLKGDKMGGSIALTRVGVPPDEDLNLLKTKQDIDGLMDRLASDHQTEGYNGYLALRPGILEKTPPQYLSENPSDFITKAALTEAIHASLVKQRLVQAKVVGVNYDDLMAPVDLETKKIGAEGVTEEKGQTFGLAFVMLFFI